MDFEIQPYGGHFSHLGVISTLKNRLIVAFWMHTELKSCGKGWTVKWRGPDPNVMPAKRMNKKRKICSPHRVGNLCGVSDFDPDDLGMNGCNGLVQFRILGFPHHFNGLPDPGQRLALSAAVTTG